MAIKQPYEISIWSEILGENGQKVEHKDFIIGGNDMQYLGRATSIKFEKKLDGTHTLTFSMPDSFYDSKLGEYVQNEFIDQLYNERKVKFFFKKEWYELYIKQIADAKNHKSVMKTFTCSDAFIDELSRNGYGITFDEELYNNVEEIGIFTNAILEDSIWKYTPENNWGDFTEYIEEKLYKIPVSQFNKIVGYKLNFSIENTEDKIVNLYTGEERSIEMGDDLASIRYFWDQLNGDNALLGKEEIEIENDGFIYVPISQLDFCYKTTSAAGGAVLTATEEIISIPNHSYALAPATVDPSALIQFIAIPEDAVVEIDEAGLIVNKEFTYVMTVAQWNEALKHNKWFYEFEPFNQFTDGVKRVNKTFKEEGSLATGNYCAYYEGYLNSIGDQEVVNGKKISISDRTEINPTDDIDQFVTVYNRNAKPVNIEDIYTKMLEDSNDWILNEDEYRICSKTETRQVVPQLARNLIQNGVNIKSVDGWEVADLNMEAGGAPATITFVKDEANGSRLTLTKSSSINEKNNTIINFGICAQEVQLSSEKVYCFGYEGHLNSNCRLIIGEGSIQGAGEYDIDKSGYENGFNIFNENEGKTFTFIKVNKEIKNPYIAIILDGEEDEEQYIKEMWFFECFTRGVDQFETGAFKYSGRPLFEESLKHIYLSDSRTVGLNNPYTKQECQHIVLFEDSIMPGDTYAYQEYFIQQVQARKVGEDDRVETLVNDTFMAKEFISPDGNLSSRDLPYSSKEFTQDDLTFVTRKYNMNKCPYYKEGTLAQQCDCCYPDAGAGEGDKLCMYQKYGYCPYLFQTEKHCRKIRTLKQEKSNRFNLTQELSKVFEIYPVYWTRFNSQGKILFDENGSMDKRIFYITEKGKENKLGFRYEKNLSNITRTLKSDQIVTKLYVEDVDSEFSNTGLCSIKTAPDNVSKDNFIIDMSYYVAKGMLDEEQLERDLYGKEEGDLAYLKQLGYYNNEYDKLANLIINLSSESFTELEANIEVNLEAIVTAQQQLLKLRKQLSKYGFNNPDEERPNGEEKVSSSVQNMFTKYDEQKGILEGLFDETFFSDGNAGAGFNQKDFSVEKFKESDDYKYHTYSYGMIGQYNSEYRQIQEWRRRQAVLLSKINELSLRFYRKYEPYLKEGTWTDGNYLTDNAYFHGAKEVAAEGAIPKVSYSITVVDLSALPDGENYEFDIADTTYVEDVGIFGINKKTGMPNRLKVLISGITYDPDQPASNTITVQNFTTQFEDLFKQVSASVQSLTFNENIYKRSSNFTSNQTIKEDSIQGTLDNNNLTLINTQESNIELDSQGQQGSDINNHSNKYKLNGQGLFFSNNGGQSWNVGVGPSGINADYIKVGNLDAGKIKIMDNDYLYFYWDKDGIVALKEPISNNGDETFSNFAVFNRTGLSLVKDSKVRLRAGYDLSVNIDSNTKPEDLGKFDAQEDTTGDIGFYLYDTKGHKIFATRTKAEDNEEDKDISARIDLRGEMCANDSGITDIFKITYYDSFILIDVQCEHFKLDNSTELTNNTINSKTIKQLIIDIANGTEIIQPSYTDSDNNTIIITKGTSNNIIYRTNNMYKINVTTYTISGNDKYSGKYICDSNTIYKHDGNQVIKLLQNENRTYDQSTLGEEEVYFYTNPDQTQGQRKCFVEIGSNGEKHYYRNSSTERVESVVSNNDIIGVYINNMGVNDTDYQGQTLPKRIFSCVKFNKDAGNSEVDNLFTILTDGSVYMGGVMRVERNEKQQINNFDYRVREIKDTSNRKLLKLDAEGGIYFGNQNIIDNLQSQIDKIIEDGVLPHQHHSEGDVLLKQGWSRVWVQNENGNLYINPNEVLSQGYVDLVSGNPI